jgi:hypothetical protein
MSDLYPLTAPVVKADGADLTQTSVQLAFNTLAGAVRTYLNQIGTGGTFINPVITGGTIDNTIIGGLVPAAGTFTTLSATSLTLSSALTVANGGTGLATLTAHAVLLGEGTSNVSFAAPGASGTLLASNGAAADPTFQTHAALGIADLASPAFTGTPTAPTAAAHTNTTQLATTAFVETEFASPPTAGVGSVTPSPGAFTTLTASTPVGVASGGTGRATLTSHGVLVGEGTAAIGQTVAGTTGQMLLGVTGADPAFGNNPTITGGTVDNAVIGGTTKAAGSFTTITATGTITPSSTNGIVGTATNDNANAGSVGEYATNTTSTTSLTSGVSANATSISLTAGDWDVEGIVQFSPAGTTVTSLIAAGISTTSATFGAFQNNQLIAGLSNNAGAGSITLATPVSRISIAGTTTVFLVALASFTVSTETCNGFIRARRVR